MYFYAPKNVTLDVMAESERICRYCNKAYPESSFGVALTTPAKTYRRWKCCHCYRDTKQALIRRYFQWLGEYKRSRGCGRCGVTDPRVLDFHHKSDEDKEFGIGEFRRAVGFDRIKEEVKKCDVVCANCHRILHDEMRSRKNHSSGV